MQVHLYLEVFLFFYTWNFFSQYTRQPAYSFGIHRFNQRQIENIFSIHGWESTDAENQLFTLFYAILRYIRDLSFRFWYLQGSPGTSPPQIKQGMIQVWGSQKL